ncbi:2Fe-2S iron-sulfur cluster-binding protein [Longimicrobium terrae]|uniref:NADH-quinone oxidoreductase subunit G n=1 Tax=Longimicrobium terrae TaxID=1639882 RepID=A0A841GZW8_9BACT|nr:2Fe-2S iron-sulfur cluster-binding protein [Longimicrobium terrae]MBB4637041.1 NADH-quinone oxidoreductase subunit G [Longimicrobium terrae]MBB6071351.1 NADH-quinone oxidoreductase subunit G [Longimicrobium terrae]NNC31430.1 molybdopterin-dependent oxidoreductase [Longimicrobium terrae]
MAEPTPTPENVSVTIDGMTLSVPKGTRLLDACAQAGVSISHYCYHPGLSAPAQCRMCLVEVEKSPKLVASCVGTVADGMVVHTQSENALKAREGVLEFYLVNHPLDCPVCDQAGECKLQDYVSAEGPPMGRSKEPKRVLGRDDFGGDVMFYADRCVMCTRCVRFMREVAQDERLTTVQRGSRTVIDTFYDEGLTGNIWADNIVDLCPVGALVSKDFLHKARAWDLDRTPSVCPNCSMGCNVRLETRDNQVMRLKPRPNPEVNAHWMCDFGRLNYSWMNRVDRIEAPLVRDGGRHVPMSWADTLTRLADALRGAAGGARAVVSPFEGNEGIGALRRVLEAVGGGDGVFRCEQGEEVILPGFPELALRRDRAANVVGAELFGFARTGGADGKGGLEQAAAHTGVLFVLGDELADAPADFGANASLFVYVGQHLAPAARNAHFVLPATTFAEMEGTFTNIQRRVQRFWPAQRAPGMARPSWQILGVLLAGISEAGAPGTAADAFAGLGAVRAEFGQLSWAELGAQGAVLPGVRELQETGD